MQPDSRRISSRTPAYDHAGVLITFYARDRVRELMVLPHVHVRGSKGKIKSLHFLGPDPAHLAMSGSKRGRPAGTPHRNENYYNPPGCWHLDRIPKSWKPMFRPSTTNVEETA